MRRKGLELFFSVLSVPLDYVCVVAAGFAAYALRFTTFAEIIPVSYQILIGDFSRIAFFAAGAWLVLFALLGLYRTHTITEPSGEAMRVFIGATSASAVFIFIIFFSQQLFASRFIILASWALSVVFVIAGRIVLRLVYRMLLTRGIGIRHVFVFSSHSDDSGVLSGITQHPESGFRIVHTCSVWDADALAALKKFHQQEMCDEVLILSNALSKDEINTIIQTCAERHITFRYSAALLPVPLMHFGITTIAGMPIIEMKRTPLEGWGRVWKRLFDMCVSAFLCIVLSPVFLLLALLVRLTSAGPAFVSLLRIGEKGTPFSLYKFRSMVVGAERLKEQLLEFNERQDGPLFKMKDDPRITKLGKFLRTTSLDELPQLWNVLKGDMSLVGPRPHEPQEVAKYSAPYKQLLAIKPGMTGLAQISGRSDLTFDKEAQLDISYIVNWSMAKDIRILFKTPSAVLSRKSAV